MIGCEYISTGDRLPGCHADIVNVRNVLTKQYGYLNENITVLADDTWLSNTSPTMINILRAFRDFVEVIKSKSATHAVFYYSGHGTQTKDLSGDEVDGEDEAMVPLDYRTKGVIPDDLIRKELWEKLSGTSLVQLTAIFDCCNSGTMMDLPYMYNYPQKIERLAKVKLSNNDQLQQQQQPLILCISGCKDPQTSASAYNLERRNEWQGAMSWSIRQIMATKKAVSVKNFIDSLRKILNQHKFTQVPQLTLSREIDLNDTIVLF